MPNWAKKFKQEVPDKIGEPKPDQSRLLTDEDILAYLEIHYPHMYRGNDEAWCRLREEDLRKSLNTYDGELLKIFQDAKTARIVRAECEAECEKKIKELCLDENGNDGRDVCKVCEANIRAAVLKEIKEYAIEARRACDDGIAYQKKILPNERQAIICFGCKRKAFQQIIDKCGAMR